MRIGVLCSGGDSPGMNACVRAVVRSGILGGHEVIGIRRGYQGLLEKEVHVTPDGSREMTLDSVADIIQHGGTILRSSRCEEFKTVEGTKKAAANLQRLGIDALIPIGGDGTLCGAVHLLKHWGGQIVGCPGTIDNDLLGTDYTIGFHTAVATAVDAVDKLRDTAESHKRMFLVEVMGRHSGYIALYTALASGAAVVCLPETQTDLDDIAARLQRMQQRGRSSIMVIVAEGDEHGGVEPILEKLKARDCPFSMRCVQLGHIQRGGSPAVADRILGTRLGEFAVRSIAGGATGVMAGQVQQKMVLTPLEETFAAHKPVPAALVELQEQLAG
jgi:6-phosphofructokinase 1